MSDNWEQNREADGDANQETEQEMDVLTLTDENGVQHEFQIVGEAEHNNQNYIALIPIFEDGQDLLDDDAELIVLKVVEENGEEFFEPIENDEEFDEISAIFVESLSDEFEFYDE